MTLKTVKQLRKSTEPKASSLIDVNKISKPPARLNKTNSKKAQIISFRKEIRVITTNSMDIKMIIKKYCKQHYTKFFLLFRQYETIL